MKIKIIIVLISIMNISCTKSIIGIDNWNRNHLSNFKKNVLKKNFEIKKQKLKKGEIEIQIWEENISNGKHRLLILKKDLSGNWNGKSFKYYFYNQEHQDLNNILIEPIKFKNGWKKDWKEIVSKRYLNINTQKKVDEKMKKLNTTDSILIVADGKAFTILIREKNKSKSIKFSNPDNYKTFYNELGIETDEYDKFLSLLEIIFNNFDE